ncbi:MULTISPECIES: hypothetical protein [unclassified Roseburia]|uniref:hypothetical protein n=1 Tax=unclassified Roseburia TaxID=2637578 RepID=UPI000E46E8A4|nr:MULTISPECIES: hypothetical protein [unclassified Roseburia]RGI48466.1 hypothetical protein DXB39_07045 [Roseburia sp. OM03-7AC]RGI51636.1 hypothetical protein DXB35_06640 [Roseburia sp. OM03-18]
MEGLREIQNYEQFKKALDTELANQAAGFVRTGYLLKKARDTDILASSGYSTVAEFAKAEYGLSKDIVSRYIAINDRYSEGGYSDRLQDKYEGYGVAKLQDMLTLPIEVVDLISPEMTRKEIAEVKAEVKAEEAISPLEVAIEGTDEQQADMELCQKAIYKYAKDNPEKFKELVKWTKDGDSEELESILAPSGIAVLASRPQGIGKVFTSFKGEGQPVDILAVKDNEKQTLSMDEYAAKVREVFVPVADMPDAYEKTFGVAPVQPENVPEKPENVPKKPENVEKTECEVLSGEVVDNEPEEVQEEKATEEAPAAAGLDKNVLRGYAAAVSSSIKKLDRLWENRELEKCLEELTSICWRIEQIQKNGGNAE